MFEDHVVGEEFNHVEGMTIGEAEHLIATRLYQNTAKGYFASVSLRGGLFGRRRVNDGHIVSLDMGLSFSGLDNVSFITASNDLLQGWD